MTSASLAGLRSVPSQLAAVRPAPIEVTYTDSNIAERVVLMTASALFTGLTVQDCNKIASCAKARVFARDELLFMQGQPVSNLVLIQSGSVKLTQLRDQKKHKSDPRQSLE